MPYADAEQQREAKNQSQNRINRDARDIGPPPPPLDGDMLEIRKACDQSLKRFLETCCRKAFPLKWSDDHLQLIEDIEQTGLKSGLLARAMPRGSGKTTILLRALLWLVLTGRRKFAMIIAATAKMAKALLRDLKNIILHNAMLQMLYGEELHAVIKLGNENKKAALQTCKHQLTGVLWGTEDICLGFVKDTKMQGACISAAGITGGGVRGPVITLPNGDVQRPDILLIDDPQTKKSARSTSQTQARYEAIMESLGMAGPSKQIAAYCSCTVIQNGDLSSQLLDPEENPEWRGKICKLVYEWPEDETLWEEYREVRNEELRSGGDGTVANQWVIDHWGDLHRGAKVGWNDRKGGLTDADDDDESVPCVSALQYAYHLRFRNEVTFWAEYQNTPLGSIQEKRFDLKAKEIAERTGPHPRYVVDAECEKLTAFADIQGNVIFYIVMGWTMKGRGFVLDYGTFPDQKKLYFTKRQIRFTLQQEARTKVATDALFDGLTKLSDKLLGRMYRRADGADLAIDRMGIDCRYQTRTVRRFCRESNHRGKLTPMMGQYISKDRLPWDYWTHKKGMRLGVHCRTQPPPQNQPGAREVLTDTNWWKSWCAERLTTSIGSDKAILLYDDRRNATHHQLISEHWTAEDAIDEENKSGVMVTEWKQKHSGIDNDLWDCLVGASVLASIEGVPVEDGPLSTPKKKKARRRRRKVSPLKC
ncbi:terminase gpA endonuclease subunit [Roseiconus lacunae]|uniref:terminase gpA endonuclease subunit n=1 Tax=Roseiconus lacunae TaxID=2605694 RepID=UPI003093117D|nr:terminase gpA endonuclease subunit [Stieleria sp. HD01]